MDSKLKNLRESMNKTVLKEGVMSDIEKRKIYRAALNGKVRRRRNYFAPVLSAIVLTGLFLTLGSFTYLNLFVSNKNSDNSLQLQNSSVLEKEDDEQISVTPKATEDEDVVQNTDENLINNQPGYPHIVLNDYYYKKTSEVIQPEDLGEQIAEVKRIGTWEIKKSGDSNYIAPGPIYSVKGRSSDEYIVGKGGIFEDGVNKSAYIVFKKEEPVQQVDHDKILNTKGDIEEALIAVDNIKRKMENFYQLNNTDRVELNYVSYLPKNGPGAELGYNILETDKVVNKETIQRMLFIKEYEKQLQPTGSRFNPYMWITVSNGDGQTATRQKQEVPPPVLIETFEMNGILWSHYTDQVRNDIVLRGEKDDMYYEVTNQGDFSLEKLKELLAYFTED